ncbi:DedA family protein [Candidatus Aminicenantes bacterium AH-873-B07]|jgi:membrane protein YqaA with SNARE-associated domain|nr:DedA family protein [Candidatus Aminicenantes bacterium AH-873-B07]
MKLLRKLYDWVLHWAKTPYGSLALFLLAFAESSFFPIPPDVLLIALILGSISRAFRFAFLCSLGSILGGIFGYFIGYKLWWVSPGVYSNIAHFFFNYVPGFTENLFQAIKVKYDAWNFWIVFSAGFTIIPYKVITISAGAFNINFSLFLLASSISRSARFFLVAGFFRIFGEKVKSFIDKYFDLLALLFLILLIIGFIIIKLIFK